MTRHNAWVRRVLDGAGAGLSEPALEVISTTRERIDDTLGACRVHLSVMDQWERVVYRHGEVFSTVPPITLLSDVLVDFGQLRKLLEQPQSLAASQRLTRVVALVTTVVGNLLCYLANPTESRAWLRTAGVAADETGDRALRAWVLLQEAHLSLYFGNPHAVIELTQQATALAGDKPSVAAALAPAVAARALALLGRARETEAALERAYAAHARLRPEDTDPVNVLFNYPERVLHFHASNALTHIHRTARAYQERKKAAALYAKTSEHIHPALMDMDHALCLIYAGGVNEACRYAQRTLRDLPSEYRVGIVWTRARAVLDAIPAKFHQTPYVRAFQEVVVLAEA